jgi:hypothetical protein
MTGPRQRRRNAWIAGGSAVLVLVLTVVSRAPRSPVAPAEPSALPVALAAAPPSHKPAAGAPSERPPVRATGQVDIARVEAAIERANATTARITREQIIAEQRRMADAKARFEAIKIPEPEQRPFTDAHGTRWVELRYESGEIRYQLAPESESPQPAANL